MIEMSQIAVVQAETASTGEVSSLDDEGAAADDITMLTMKWNGTSADRGDGKTAEVCHAR